MDVLAYLDRSIATFDNDPPVNEYQRGHLDALKVARAEIATSLVVEITAGESVQGPRTERTS